MKQRDDTPSVIRQTETMTGLRRRERLSRGSSVPVLEISKSTRTWQKIRWPLIIILIVVFLCAVGLITNDLLTARGVEKTIESAWEAEQRGTVESLKGASEALAELADDYSSRANAQAAWAWQAGLEAVLLGPADELIQQAQTALTNAGAQESDRSRAAKALLLHLTGEYQQALDQADAGLTGDGVQPRLELARAWALHGLGRAPDAFERLDAAIEASPQYTPLVLSAIDIALQANDRLKALAYLKLLQSAAGEYLLGELATIQLSLPVWAGKPLPGEQAGQLLDRTVALKARIDDAPFRLNAMGRYLLGRVHLLTERYEEAQQHLSEAMRLDPAGDALVWNALATKRLKGPRAALEVLDSRRDSTDPKGYDLRAQALLELHRVAAATKAIDELQASKTLPERATELSFVAVVRRGDLDAAMARLPATITVEHQRIALELYFQLKEQGRHNNIFKLINRFDSTIKSCGMAIKYWHSRRTSRALRALDPASENSCIAILAAQLLRKHAPPDLLYQALARSRDKYVRDFELEINTALVSWMVEGYEPAKKRLEDVWALAPTGAPLRCSLARAYLEMALPLRALEVLEGLQTPGAVAIRFEANKMQHFNKGQKYVRKALKKHGKVDHPAIDYLRVHSQFTSSRFRDIADHVQEIATNGGRWTAAIAEFGAKAINFEGDRTEADQLLAKIAKRASVRVGMDEAWNVKLALVRLNLRRGGKFSRRALYMLTEMEKDDLVDPRILTHLADLHFKEGNDRLAIRRLKAALKIDPTFRLAYQQLEKHDALNEELTAQRQKMWPQ